MNQHVKQCVSTTKQDERRLDMLERPGLTVH